MSNLLKEAIIDAQALKEAALKNAEAAIIDKYSDEVKQTIENLLEQDELGALGSENNGEPRELTTDEIPLAATDNLNEEEGKNLEEMPEEGQEIEFNVDLGVLQEAIQQLQTELDESQEIELSPETIEELLSDNEVLEEEEELEEEIDVDPVDDDAAKEEADIAATDSAGLEEDQDVSEDLLDAVMERLTVDMAAELSGWAGRSAESTKFEMEKGLAHRRSTDYVEDILEPMKKAQEELTFENKQLKQQVSQYKQAVDELKETLVETNLSNGRLLYTNRVLRNTSLNERQKERIVEAISNAGSVTEAKTIYDTLQSTVQATPKRSPQSLSEAISRRSSVIRATRQESTAADPHLDRMQKLAGIK